jgi:drug/metabolite transporter (DMT)-like permease
MLNIQHILVLLIAAIAYVSWSLLAEDKETVKKILLLTFLVAALLILLVYLSLKTLKHRVSRLERWNFKRNYLLFFFGIFFNSS